MSFVKIGRIVETKHDWYTGYGGVKCEKCGMKYRVRVYFYESPKLENLTKITSKCKCGVGIFYSKGVFRIITGQNTSKALNRELEKNDFVIKDGGKTYVKS